MSDERDNPALWWLAAVLAVAVAIIAAYSNSLQNGFHLDDHYGITPNPWIRSLANIPQFFTDPNTYTTLRENVDYRPMATLSYAVNYAVSELQPWSWHVMNLLLHGVVCVSVFALGRALLGTGRAAPVPRLSERDGDWASLAAAVLFAVHPVGAGCANYMWARSSLLVAAFLLPATVLYIRAVQHGSAWRYGASLALFACALFSKVEAVSFLAVAALAEFLLAPSRLDRSLLARFWPRRGDLRLAPVAALAAAYVGLWMAVLPPGRSANWAASDLNRWQYLLTQTGAWWYYLGKVVAPVNLIADYGGYPKWLSLAEPPALYAIAAWLVVLGAMVLAARRAPGLVLLAGAFFIHLSPTSSVVPLSEMVNEHRPYLPLTGVFLIGAAGLAAAVRALPSRPAPAALAGVVLALALPLTFLTRERNGVFLNGTTYWKDVAAKDPASGRAQLNYAMELWGSQPAEAERRMREAVRLWPNWHYGHTNLGVFLDHHGRHEEARRSFNEAVRCGPSSAIPAYYRGKFLFERGELPGAAADLKRAVENASAPVRERALYAEVLLAMGNTEEAHRQVAEGEKLDAAAFAALRARLGGR